MKQKHQGPGPLLIFLVGTLFLTLFGFIIADALRASSDVFKMTPHALQLEEQSFEAAFGRWEKAHEVAPSH